MKTINLAGWVLINIRNYDPDGIDSATVRTWPDWWQPCYIVMAKCENGVILNLKCAITSEARHIDNEFPYAIERFPNGDPSEMFINCQDLISQVERSTIHKDYLIAKRNTESIKNLIKKAVTHAADCGTEPEDEVVIELRNKASHLWPEVLRMLS